MAITKTTEGHLTITDLTDITDVYLQYSLALANAMVTNSYTFSGSGEIGWSTTYPTWVSGYQIWIRQVRIKEGMTNPEYGTPYLDTAVNQINLSIGTINSDLQTRLKYFWDNLNNNKYPKGTYMAGGIEGVTFDYENSSTYGYNTYYANGIKLRYNSINLTTLLHDGLSLYYPVVDDDNNIVDSAVGASLSVNALSFFQPPIINGSNVTQGNKTLELNGDSLSFYGSSTSTPDATLTSNGLKLVKGGIEAGKPNTNDFVYISSTDFVGQIKSFYRLTLDTEIEDDKTYYEYDKENDTYTAISSPTIEDIESYYEYYTPSQGAIAIDNFVKRNWRQIIGTNFAVDSDGNLYASNADISGIINAESGSIGGFEINNTQLYSNGHDSPDSINNGIYIGSDKLAFGPASTTYFENTGSGKIGPWYFDDGNIYINIDEYRTIKIGTNGLVLTDYDTVTNSNFKTNGIEFNFGLQNDEYISVQILDKILIKNDKLTINADTITLNNKDLNAWFSLFEQNITDNKQRINNAFTYINNYEFYIATTPNNTSGYIQLKRKSNNNASSIKITDSIIELSINQNNITTYKGNLMHTTFGEFENLRMRVGTTGSLTWIARSNGHLSLKVVN